MCKIKRHILSFLTFNGTNYRYKSGFVIKDVRLKYLGEGEHNINKSKFTCKILKIEDNITSTRRFCDMLKNGYYGISYYEPSSYRREHGYILRTEDVDQVKTNTSSLLL